MASRFGHLDSNPHMSIFQDLDSIRRFGIDIILSCSRTQITNKHYFSSQAYRNCVFGFITCSPSYINFLELYRRLKNFFEL